MTTSSRSCHANIPLHRAYWHPFLPMSFLLAFALALSWRTPIPLLAGGLLILMMSVGARARSLRPVSLISVWRHMGRPRRRNFKRISHQGSWEYDMRRDRIHFNDDYCAMLGYERYQLPITFAEWLAIVHPDDQTAVKEACERVIAQTEELPVASEYRVRHGNGAWRWMYNQTQVIQRDEDNRPLYLVGSNLDITERKKAEQELAAEHTLLRTLVDSLPDHVIVLDRDHRYRLLNTVAADFLETPEAEMVGKTAADLLPAEIAAYYTEIEERIMSSGVAEFIPEFPLNTLAGEAIGRFQASKIPLRDAQGQVTGLLLIHRDITERKRFEEQLLQERQLLRTVIDTIPDPITALDTNYCHSMANRAYEEYIGRSEAELIGKTLFDVLPHDVAAGMHEWDRAIIEGEVPSLIREVAIPDPNGGMDWFWLSKVPLLDQEQRIIGCVVASRDITERRRVEEERIEERNLLRTLIDALPDVIVILDNNRRKQLANKAAQVHYGMSEAAMMGKTLFDLLPAEEARRLARAGEDPLTGELLVNDEVMEIRQGRTCWRAVSKVRLHDKEGHPTGILVIARDITSYKALEAQLVHQVRHDSLTGLPNRRFLLERLADMMRHAPADQQVAALFADIDHFKYVNDSLGHDVGDRLLIQVVERLQARLGPTTTLGRLGGDEFIVLCEQLTNPVDAVRVAHQILEATHEPIALDDYTLKISVSVGLAYLEPYHISPHDLLRDADIALFRAKEQGRNRIVLFDDALRTRAQRRLELEQALRGAIGRQEFYLVYQPKLRLRDNRLDGFEALLRWHHPVFSEIAPSDFIPIAEETGLIVEIGEWVFEQACTQLHRWHRQVPHLTMSINLSSRQFDYSALVSRLTAILVRTQVRPTAITLEITESVVMNNPPLATTLLAQLKALGLSLALDDFGTGYSSLAYVQRLPIDTLKIDRSLVMQLNRNPESEEVVRLIITLAHTLNLASVAEGVEDAGTLALLRQWGCTLIQGYLYARPLTAEMVASFIPLKPDEPDD